MSSALAPVEAFTPDEAAALAPYFGNTDRPVFVLTNLPEAVKGALFARYSRSAKSARRLFLDEFLEEGERLPSRPETGPGQERAGRLYSRILAEYGDDSVAQLGGAHLACEGISNVLTKVVERGRLMAYLEQSTRYVPLIAGPDGRWPYVVPAELADPALRSRFVETLDRGVRDLRPLDGAPARVLPRTAPAGRRRLGGGCTGPSSAPRPSTPCAGCCRRLPGPTSGSTVPDRPTRRCCSGCRPMIWPRAASWRG